jgi:hypothetical protein
MVNDMQYSLVIYSTAYQSDFNGVSSHYPEVRDKITRINSGNACNYSNPLSNSGVRGNDNSIYTVLW